jgi:23S rRNA (adenine2503-C2)-methyltransferase
MKVIAKTGESDLATVYIADFGDGRRAEFVESVQPPIPRSEKWVLIVSTLFGCPIGCSICDAGKSYCGKLSAEQILDQVDFAVRERYPSGNPDTKRFKIQFSRMGEPALNTSVIQALYELNERYKVPELIPSLSTVAPISCDNFFNDLLKLKKEIYDKSFQLQFSLHSTDQAERDKIIPVRKWTFSQIADYSREFYTVGGKKITLNFAYSGSSSVEPELLRETFSPDIFIIKITPVNPTVTAISNNLASIEPISDKTIELINKFRKVGYDVIHSVGELEENMIGSNCGQYLTHFLESEKKISNAYSYDLEFTR